MWKNKLQKASVIKVATNFTVFLNDKKFLYGLKNARICALEFYKKICKERREYEKFDEVQICLQEI